jgi:glucose/arabinose dehydrogenase
VPPPGVRGEVAVEVVASGLTVPWALAFTPDGRIFVTERPGRIRVIEKGALRSTPWATLAVTSRSESGLMGIALAPDFARSGHVYVAGSFESGGRLINRVLRLTDRNGSGTDQVVLIDDLPSNEIHAGSAVAFGPDGKLYVTVGDAANGSSAQDLGTRAGKVLRYNPDGSIPTDNPFRGSPVYAYGLRNTQGLAWKAPGNTLFAPDHGPTGENGRYDHDELNVIHKGGNYGWPVVIGTQERSGMTAPIAVWTPAIAPSGIAVYTGTAIQEWSGNLFVGALRGQQLRRIAVEPATGTPTGWRVSGQEALFEKQYGRIRLVHMGPDGALYFGTSNRDGRGSAAQDDDRIFRIVRK